MPQQQLKGGHQREPHQTNDQGLPP